ncbi:hypothetical protein XW59_015730 [Aquamicrobium sp. LC103]|nr:hypothetical protein XW59_015730 [Aquamicrobium sp. LC103]
MRVSTAFRLFAASFLLAGIALAGCQSRRGSEGVSTSGKSAALATMEQVAISAQKCWFASKDPAFAPYRMANELNSFSGRPRILLVPARSPESRPLLVVQAEGTPARVDVFGPMMDQAGGSRIAADVRRWAAGSGECHGAA